LQYPLSNETTIYQRPGVIYLESGETLEDVQVGYRTWGEPRSEAILICHALTGSADADEWWEGLFGSNRSFDPDHDFVIASNVLGGCYGTTGPISLRPGTDRWYGRDFPRITIRDMVDVQAGLLDHLEVETLGLVIGGSMGGMQALEWAAMYPDRVGGGVAIGVGSHHSAWSVAFSEAQRAAIWADPKFLDGDYEPRTGGRPTSSPASGERPWKTSSRSSPTFATRARSWSVVSTPTRTFAWSTPWTAMTWRGVAARWTKSWPD
jgi:homoserine O-acetyltransferase